MDNRMVDMAVSMLESMELHDKLMAIDFAAWRPGLNWHAQPMTLTSDPPKVHFRLLCAFSSSGKHLECFRRSTEPSLQAETDTHVSLSCRHELTSV